MVKLDVFKLGGASHRGGLSLSTAFFGRKTPCEDSFFARQNIVMNTKSRNSTLRVLRTILRPIEQSQTLQVINHPVGNDFPHLAFYCDHVRSGFDLF